MSFLTSQSYGAYSNPGTPAGPQNCKDFGTVWQTRLQVVSIFPQRNASARDNHPTREKATRDGERFLAWGDFHARSGFARSTIPEEKWGLLVVYATTGLSELFRGGALNLLLRRVLSNEEKNTKKYSELATNDGRETRRSSSRFNLSGTRGIC